MSTETPESIIVKGARRDVAKDETIDPADLVVIWNNEARLIWLPPNAPWDVRRPKKIAGGDHGDHLGPWCALPGANVYTLDEIAVITENTSITRLIDLGWLEVRPLDVEHSLMALHASDAIDRAAAVPTYDDALRYYRNEWRPTVRDMLRQQCDRLRAYDARQV